MVLIISAQVAADLEELIKPSNSIDLSVLQGSNTAMCILPMSPDGSSSIGVVELSENHLVCKPPIEKNNKNTESHTVRDQFWVMGASGDELHEWLRKHTQVKKEKTGEGERAFYAFSYSHLTAGNKDLNVGGIEVESTSSPFLCAVSNPEGTSIEFGYVFPDYEGGERCILSTKVKYAIQPKAKDVVYVETSSKGWCHKEKRGDFCQAKKDHAHVAVAQCEKEAKEQGVGYCFDPSGACCFLKDGRKLNRADHDGGKNRCFLPDNVNEESMYTSCGGSDFLNGVGRKLKNLFD